MSTIVTHLTLQELEAGLEDVRQSPCDAGVLELIVRRPAIGERDVVEEATFDVVHGLVGDSWARRGSTRSAAIPRPTSLSGVRSSVAVTVPPATIAIAAGSKNGVSASGVIMREGFASAGPIGGRSRTLPNHRQAPPANRQSACRRPAKACRFPLPHKAKSASNGNWHGLC